MGIHELRKVIEAHAPKAITTHEMKDYMGRTIAIDASVSLYQFLISIRQLEGNTSLTDASGEATSHILGMFYRTIRLIVNGIKPVYVFDGKPPEEKSGELSKRKKRVQEAKEKLEEIRDGDEEGVDKEEIAKLEKRTTRVTEQQNNDIKKLCRLMGVPVVEAPSEAEAQCAALNKAGLVWATASEDMDSLTLGTNILLRYLNVAESRKIPVNEIHVDKVLEGLGFDYDQFVDLCILLGCDYCDTIRGIGPVRAVELIAKYKNIETVIKHIDTKKYPVPENFNYQRARELFKTPEVLDPATIELKWKDPDEEGLVEFLVKDKGFNEERVRSGIAKLKKARSGSVQQRIDSFFSFAPKPPPASKPASALKRKGSSASSAAAKKKKK